MIYYLFGIEFKSIFFVLSFLNFHIFIVLEFIQFAFVFICCPYLFHYCSRLYFFAICLKNMTWHLVCMFACVQNIFKRTLTSLSYGTLKSFLFYYYYSLFNKSKIDQTYIIELVFCCCCCHQRKKKKKFQILFHNDDDDDGYDEKKNLDIQF